MLLAAVAVFQVALASGAPLGRLAWGGQHVVLPRHLRIGSAVSTMGYAGMALVVLQGGGLLTVLPDGAADVALWVLTAFLGLGVVMNVLSRSRPERLVMTPVVLTLAVVCLVLALQ